MRLVLGCDCNCFPEQFPELLRPKGEGRPGRARRVKVPKTVILPSMSLSEYLCSDSVLLIASNAAAWADRNIAAILLIPDRSTINYHACLFGGNSTNTSQLAKLLIWLPRQPL